MLPCVRIIAFLPASCFSSLCGAVAASRVQSLQKGWLLRSRVATGSRSGILLIQSSAQPRRLMKFSELFGFAAFNAWFRNLME